MAPAYRALHRHAVLTQHGAVVLHFTPQQVRTDPRALLATVERTYVERPRSGVRSRIRWEAG